MEPKRGIYRYLNPKLYPVYGILLAYIIILIARFLFGILLYQVDVFFIGEHAVTVADLLIISFAGVGVFLWLKSR